MNDANIAEHRIAGFIKDNLTLAAKIKKNRFYIDQWTEVAVGARKASDVTVHPDDVRGPGDPNGQVW